MLNPQAGTLRPSAAKNSIANRRRWAPVAVAAARGYARVDNPSHWGCAGRVVLVHS